MKKNLKKRQEFKDKIQESYFSIKYAREEYSDFMTSQEITVAWNIEQDLKKYLENIDKNNFYLKEKK